MQEQQKTIEEIAAEPDVAAAINAAKMQVAAQWAVFGIEPEVFVIEACGLPCVLLPWTAQKRLLAVRSTAAIADQTEKALKLADAVVNDCLVWIRGQQGEGKPGALKHIRGLADLVGGRYMDLVLQVGVRMLEMAGVEEGQHTVGKKL